MDFGGRYRFGARRPEVWKALNDAGLLQRVIPGCEQMRWTSPSTLELSVRANLGIVHPLFSGELVLSDIDPARSYTLTGHGKGGMLGLAHASANISLRDDGEGTILAFQAAGNADGGIMRLGRALIGNSAQRLIDGFFQSIGEQMQVNVTALSQD